MPSIVKAKAKPNLHRAKSVVQVTNYSIISPLLAGHISLMGTFPRHTPLQHELLYDRQFSKLDTDTTS